MKKFGLPFLLILLLLPLSPVYPQSDAKYSPITPDNVHQLTEIARMGRGLINDMEWSPDGQWLAVATSNGVFVYDTGDWEQEPLTLPGYNYPVSDIDWQPEGERFVTIDVRGNIRHWDTTYDIVTENKVESLPLHERLALDFPFTRSIHYFSENLILLELSCFGRRCFWDAVNGRFLDDTEIEQFGGYWVYGGEHWLIPRDAAQNPTTIFGNNCESRLPPCQIKVIDKQHREAMSPLEVAPSEYYKIHALDVNREWLAISGDYGAEIPASVREIRMVSINNGSIKAVLTPPFPYEPITSIAIDPDGQYIAAANMFEIYLWDTETKELTATLGGYGPPASEIIEHPSDEFLIVHLQDASLFAEGAISFREMESWQHLATIPGQGTMTLSPDGQQLYVSNYSFLGLAVEPDYWDISDPRTPQRVEGPNFPGININAYPLSDFAVYPDDQHMLIARSGGNYFEFWDLVEERVINQFQARAFPTHLEILFNGKITVLHNAGKLYFLEMNRLFETFESEYFDDDLPEDISIPANIYSISANEQLVVTGIGVSRSILTWYDTNSLQQAGAIDIEAYFIDDIVFNSDGSLLVAAGCSKYIGNYPCQESTIWFIDTASSSIIWTIVETTQGINSIAFGHNDQYLYVGYGESKRHIDGDLLDKKYIGVYAVGVDKQKPRR